ATLDMRATIHNKNREHMCHKYSRSTSVCTSHVNERAMALRDVPLPHTSPQNPRHSWTLQASLIRQFLGPEKLCHICDVQTLNSLTIPHNPLGLENTKSRNLNHLR